MGPMQTLTLLGMVQTLTLLGTVQNLDLAGEILNPDLAGGSDLTDQGQVLAMLKLMPTSVFALADACLNLASSKPCW